MLEKIRLDVDQVFSRLGLRPKVPIGFRLRARRWFSFSGPRLGSWLKFLGAALEPCSGLSLGVGSFLGQIVPQKRVGLVPGTVMGSGFALLALMGPTSPVIGSTSLVTFEADVVPYFGLGLPVVAFAEVFATMLDVSATLMTISMISEQAESDSMDPGSLADTVTEVLVASTGSGEASCKTVRRSFPAKGLLRRGFLGLSPTSSLSVLGTPPFLTVGSGVSSCGAVEMGTRLCLCHPGMTDSGTPIYSSVSKS